MDASGGILASPTGGTLCKWNFLLKNGCDGLMVLVDVVFRSAAMPFWLSPICKEKRSWSVQLATNKQRRLGVTNVSKIGRIDQEVSRNDSAFLIGSVKNATLCCVNCWTVATSSAFHLVITSSWEINGVSRFIVEWTARRFLCVIDRTWRVAHVTATRRFICLKLKKKRMQMTGRSQKRENMRGVADDELGRELRTAINLPNITESLRGAQLSSGVAPLSDVLVVTRCLQMLKQSQGRKFTFNESRDNRTIFLSTLQRLASQGHVRVHYNCWLTG